MLHKYTKYRVYAYFMAFSFYFFSANAASAQEGPTPLDEVVMAHCVSAGVDECYRDGLNNLIRNQYLPELRKILGEEEIHKLDNIRFVVAADRDALGASAGLISGSPTIRITTALGFYVHRLSYAAAINILLDKDISVYERYQTEVAEHLKKNTRRARLGEDLVEAPDYLSIARISDQQMSRIKETKFLAGLSSYIFQTTIFFVLSHEVGHHLIGDGKFGTHGPERRINESSADEFAARIFVKMGYSVYPTLFIMEYLDAVERVTGADADYPLTRCRLARIFKAAWSERSAYPERDTRDAANQNMNNAMDAPAVRRRADELDRDPLCQ